MNIKPIKTKLDYDNSLSRINMLMDATPNSKEFDELDILTTLVEAYEDIHYKIEIPDPIEAIKFRMEQESLKQKDLIPIIGSGSRVSEILNKKRKLTLDMIRNLNKDLKIPFDSLFTDYSLKYA
jgi:HTH-type transcriptional regulator/antitoxin HigA